MREQLARQSALRLDETCGAMCSAMQDSLKVPRRVQLAVISPGSKALLSATFSLFSRRRTENALARGVIEDTERERENRSVSVRQVQMSALAAVSARQNMHSTSLK